MPNATLYPRYRLNDDYAYPVGVVGDKVYGFVLAKTAKGFVSDVASGKINPEADGYRADPEPFNPANLRSEA